MSAPVVVDDERLFENALAGVVFRDGDARVRLCVADLVLANLARRLALTLASPGSGILARVEIPRGINEIAVAFAMEAQLARLRAFHQGGEVQRKCIEGSIIVVGTDTPVHARLRDIRVEGVPLDRGLRVHRIRGDGRVVAPGGGALTFQPGRRELLYLNTRVGWPNLACERDGLVVIDRTSFGTPGTLETALMWARRHDARHIVVLHNHGDPEARKVADLRWTLDGVTLSSLDPPLTLTRTDSQITSGLSLSPLMSGSRPVLGLARVNDPVIEDLSAAIHGHIAAARKIADRLPYPLFAAARMLVLGNTLAGTVKRYDQAASLDISRAKPLRDLLRAVEDGQDRLQGPWAGYRETRYAALRADIGRYFSALYQENPKFEALIFLLDDLRRRRSLQRILIRVADEAAALALEEEILEFEPRLAEGVRFVSFRHRLPWDASGLVEVLVGLPAPWRRDALWSGEARERIILAYGWEAAVLQAIANDEAVRTRKQLPERFRTTYLPLTSPAQVSLSVVFKHERRVNQSHPPPRSFDIDLADIVGDVEPEVEPYEGRIDAQPGGTSDWPVLVRVVSLEPDGARWLVPEGTEVDVLVGSKFRRLPTTSLSLGAEVIVPRGSGRESLFSRALSVIEGQGTYVDVEFVLGRWRRTCRTVLERAGSPERARGMLRDEGATTVTQIEAWADGSTLAPNDYEDLARVARLADDEWLNRNWKRVAALVRQVRGSHISLGHAISGAMREVVHGCGPNLDRLADLLGVDAASILDEFDLRVVRAVSAPILVPAATAGSVLPPG